MSIYRFKIRTNNVFFSGGTGSIEPMLNTGITNNQIFSEYLTTYRYKPGQQGVGGFNSLVSPNSIVDGYNVLNKQAQLNPLQFSQQDKKSLIISSGTTINPELNYKNITFPISFNGSDMGNSDALNTYVKSETKKLINTVLDGEKVKYTTNSKTTITFVFENLPQYSKAGFVTEDFIRNRFKKSYFRLYFFDSNDVKTQNLLLTEDISVTDSYTDTSGVLIPKFDLNRVFWNKSDELFVNTNNDRVVYMTARFFNTKTGRVHRFINPPTSTINPIDIEDIKNNNDWLSCPIKIFNPKNNGGKYKFQPIPSVGGTNIDGDEITFKEYLLKQ